MIGDTDQVDASAAWNPGQYLRFEEERTRPCRELAGRVASTPRTIIDLGCGPGNSTAVLRQRWPEADVSGLDSSDTMLASACAVDQEVTWIKSDIADWAAEEKPTFDLVFSNAALQWVDNHARVFPQLLRRVSGGGVLAIQVPADINAPAHRLMRECFHAGPVREWFVREPDFYYELLAREARTLDLWTTEYLQVVPNVEAIAEWYRGTGLRPFLNALPDEEGRNQFLRDFIEGLRREFRTRIDGNVLFPFRRLFLVAQK